MQPARVKRPQDKAIVERTIQIFQRWFFMRVRNRTFTSLVELNQCLKEHLELFNARNHRTFNRTRKEMFEESERAHLLDLPKDAYLVQTFSRAKLSRDCHLVFDYNFYSAPHTLRGLELEIWATSQTIEIYNGLDRVAVHKRYRSHGKFVTDPKHYPSAHQAYLEEDVERARQWATSVGTECAKLVEDLLSCAHPLQHLRRVQGILALSRKYSKAQLEQATAVANRFNNRTIPYLERVILNLGGERVKRDEKGGEPIKREFNPNLRGLDEILH